MMDKLSKTHPIGRRAFVGQMGLAVAGVAAASMLPVTGLYAAPANVSVTMSVTPSEPDGVWHMDHIFGHVPPYNHPIGYGRPRATQQTAELEVDPIDRNFLA